MFDDLLDYASEVSVGEGGFREGEGQEMEREREREKYCDLHVLSFPLSLSLFLIASHYLECCKISKLFPSVNA